MAIYGYNKAIRYLVVLTAFCVGMQLFRMYDTNTTTFIKMTWNLLLAWVPLLISMVMVDAAKRRVLSVLVLAWLLFFPNAPYIITDLIHLGSSPDFPHW